MKRWLMVFLVGVLIPLSPIFAQTINVSVTDWRMLRAELQISKEQLTVLNRETVNLENSLQQARVEQQNSQVSINASEEKIADLERRLVRAKTAQDQFRLRVENLENQLIGLGLSLTNTRFQLDQSEAKHIANVERLVVGYERRLMIGKLVVRALVVVAVVEGVYILIGVLVK